MTSGPGSLTPEQTGVSARSADEVPQPGIAAATPKPRAPMFTFAVALATGILLAHILWRPPLWIGLAATVAAVGAALVASQRPRMAWLLAHLGVACLGWVAMVGQGGQHAAEEDTTQLAPYLEGQPVTVIAHVTRTATAFAAGSGHEQIDVETESLDDGSQSRTISAGLRLNLYGRAEEVEYGDEPGSEGVQHLRYGDQVRLTAKLRPPKNFRNPGAWDYEDYLHRSGIVALGSAKTSSVEVLSTQCADRIGRWRYDAREAVIRRIHEIWPAEQAGLMDAMLIGERAFIDRETSTDFQRSGTFHVLVVSGMNVSILAMVIFWVMRKLRAGEWLASLVTVAVSFAYATLCDGGAPILRAAFMLSIYLMARLIYRGRSPLNALGVAAAGVLICDPAGSLDASFVMTFLCVLIIAGIGVPLLERTSEPWKRGMRNFTLVTYDASLPPRIAQFRVELRMILERLAKLGPEPMWRFIVLKGVDVAFGVWEVLLISLLMQVGLVLPMAAYFHRITVTALPANMLVVPLTEVLMPASVGAVALSYVSRTLATVPAAIAGWSLDGIMGTVHIAGSLRVADLRIPTPSFVVSIFAAVALATAVIMARRSRVWVTASLALLLASALILALAPTRPAIARNKLEVTGIDVGQADSTLLVSPQGKALLVDAAGPLGFSRSEFDYGENVVSPYLWSRGFSRIDVVVVTHGHSDHIGGMPSVIGNFRPREIWVGPLPEADSIKAVLAKAQKMGVRVVQLSAGNEFDWSGVHVRVLSPPRGWEPTDKVRNNDSLALQFSYGQTAALLEGDAEKQMEKIIATERPDCTLLKLAHNGSMTSTTPELLDAAHPSYALISVGTRNTFHHPRPEILDRLGQRGIRTYRTDTMGSVTFLLDGKTLEPFTSISARDSQLTILPDRRLQESRN